MTVTIVANANTKQTQLVTKQAEVTDLTTRSATASPSQASQLQLLKQKQEELVRGCFDCGRLDPALTISTLGTSVFSTAWLAAVHPEIAKLQTQVTASTINASEAAVQLRAAQVHAINDAMSQGLTSGAGILAAMS